MKKVLFSLLFFTPLFSAQLSLEDLQRQVEALREQVDDHQKSLMGEGDGFCTLVVARVVEALRTDPVVIARSSEALRTNRLAMETLATQAGLGVAQKLRDRPSFRRQVAASAAPEIV